ncbi:hypothetical protein ABIE93_005650 [Bradyrhizobium elkanii]
MQRGGAVGPGLGPIAGAGIGPAVAGQGGGVVAGGAVDVALGDGCGRSRGAERAIGNAAGFDEVVIDQRRNRRIVVAAVDGEHDVGGCRGGAIGDRNGEGLGRMAAGVERLGGGQRIVERIGERVAAGMQRGGAVGPGLGPIAGAGIGPAVAGQGGGVVAGGAVDVALGDGCGRSRGAERAIGNAAGFDEVVIDQRRNRRIVVAAVDGEHDVGGCRGGAIGDRNGEGLGRMAAGVERLGGGQRIVERIGERVAAGMQRGGAVGPGLGPIAGAGIGPAVAGQGGGVVAGGAVDVALGDGCGRSRGAERAIGNAAGFDEVVIDQRRNRRIVVAAVDGEHDVGGCRGGAIGDRNGEGLGRMAAGVERLGGGQRIVERIGERVAAGMQRGGAVGPGLGPIAGAGIGPAVAGQGGGVVAGGAVDVALGDGCGRSRGAERAIGNAAGFDEVVIDQRRNRRIVVAAVDGEHDVGGCRGGAIGDRNGEGLGRMAAGVERLGGGQRIVERIGERVAAGMQRGGAVGPGLGPIAGAGIGPAVAGQGGGVVAGGAVDVALGDGCGRSRGAERAIGNAAGFDEVVIDQRRNRRIVVAAVDGEHDVGGCRGGAIGDRNGEGLGRMAAGVERLGGGQRIVERIGERVAAGMQRGGAVGPGLGPIAGAGIGPAVAGQGGGVVAGGAVDVALGDGCGRSRGAERAIGNAAGFDEVVIDQRRNRRIVVAAVDGEHDVGGCRGGAIGDRNGEGLGRMAAGVERLGGGQRIVERIGERVAAGMQRGGAVGPGLGPIAGAGIGPAVAGQGGGVVAGGAVDVALGDGCGRSRGAERAIGNAAGFDEVVIDQRRNRRIVVAAVDGEHDVGGCRGGAIGDRNGEGLGRMAAGVERLGGGQRIVERIGERVAAGMQRGGAVGPGLGPIAGAGIGPAVAGQGGGVVAGGAVDVALGDGCGRSRGAERAIGNAAGFDEVVIDQRRNRRIVVAAVDGEHDVGGCRGGAIGDRNGEGLGRMAAGVERLGGGQRIVERIGERVAAGMQRGGAVGPGLGPIAGAGIGPAVAGQGGGVVAGGAVDVALGDGCGRSRGAERAIGNAAGFDEVVIDQRRNRRIVVAAVDGEHDVGGCRGGAIGDRNGEGLGRMAAGVERLGGGQRIVERIGERVAAGMQRGGAVGPGLGPIAGAGIGPAVAGQGGGVVAGGAVDVALGDGCGRSRGAERAIGNAAGFDEVVIDQRRNRRIVVAAVDGEHDVGGCRGGAIGDRNGEGLGRMAAGVERLGGGQRIVERIGERVAAGMQRGGAVGPGLGPIAGAGIGPAVAGQGGGVVAGGAVDVALGDGCGRSRGAERAIGNAAGFDEVVIDQRRNRRIVVAAVDGEHDVGGCRGGAIGDRNGEGLGRMAAGVERLGGGQRIVERIGERVAAGMQRGGAVGPGLGPIAGAGIGPAVAGQGGGVVAGGAVDVALGDGCGRSRGAERAIGNAAGFDEVVIDQRRNRRIVVAAVDGEHDVGGCRGGAIGDRNGEGLGRMAAGVERLGGGQRIVERIGERVAAGMQRGGAVGPGLGPIAGAGIGPAVAGQGGGVVAGGAVDVALGDGCGRSRGAERAIGNAAGFDEVVIDQRRNRRIVVAAVDGEHDVGGCRGGAIGDRNGEGLGRMAAGVERLGGGQRIVERIGERVAAGMQRGGAVGPGLGPIAGAGIGPAVAGQGGGVVAGGAVDVALGDGCGRSRGAERAIGNAAGFDEVVIDQRRNRRIVVAAVDGEHDVGGCRGGAIGDRNGEGLGRMAAGVERLGGGQRIVERIGERVAAGMQRGGAVGPGLGPIAGAGIGPAVAGQGGGVVAGGAVDVALGDGCGRSRGAERAIGNAAGFDEVVIDQRRNRRIVVAAVDGEHDVGGCRGGAIGDRNGEGLGRMAAGVERLGGGQRIVERIGERVAAGMQRGGAVGPGLGPIAGAGIGPAVAGQGGGVVAGGAVDVALGDGCGRSRGAERAIGNAAGFDEVVIDQRRNRRIVVAAVDGEHDVGGCRGGAIGDRNGEGLGRMAAGVERLGGGQRIVERIGERVAAGMQRGGAVGPGLGPIAGAGIGPAVAGQGGGVVAGGAVDVALGDGCGRSRGAERAIGNAAGFDEVVIDQRRNRRIVVAAMDRHRQRRGSRRPRGIFYCIGERIRQRVTKRAQRLDRALAVVHRIGIRAIGIEMQGTVRTNHIGAGARAQRGTGGARHNARDRLGSCIEIEIVR